MFTVLRNLQKLSQTIIKLQKRNIPEREEIWVPEEKVPSCRGIYHYDCSCRCRLLQVHKSFIDSVLPQVLFTKKMYHVSQVHSISKFEKQVSTTIEISISKSVVAVNTPKSIVYNHHTHKVLLTKLPPRSIRTTTHQSTSTDPVNLPPQESVHFPNFKNEHPNPISPPTPTSKTSSLNSFQTRSPSATPIPPMILSSHWSSLPSTLFGQDGRRSSLDDWSVGVGVGGVWCGFRGFERWKFLKVGADELSPGRVLPTTGLWKWDTLDCQAHLLQWLGSVEWTSLFFSLFCYSDGRLFLFLLLS